MSMGFQCLKKKQTQQFARTTQTKDSTNSTVKSPYIQMSSIPRACSQVQYVCKFNKVNLGTQLTQSAIYCVLVTQSYLTLGNPMNCSPTRLLCLWDSPGKNNGVGCQFLLQGIFLTQGLNLDLSHCRQILYHLSHQEIPILYSTVCNTFHTNNMQKTNKK